MSVTVYATSNASQVGLWFRGKGEELRIYGAAASSVLAKQAKIILTPLLVEEAPEGVSGALRASIKADTTAIVERGSAIIWAAYVPYIDFVIHGTGIYHVPDAHSPWTVQGLQHFTVGGNEVFAMSTFHEGQKPNDFPARALDRAQPALEAMLAVYGDGLDALFVNA